MQRGNHTRSLHPTSILMTKCSGIKKYVGGTGNTVPFDKAPSSVCSALALIKERSRLALQKDIPFNEILSAAYMEKQKMSVSPVK